MEGRELASRIAEIIIDKQGEDTLILDLTEITTFTDYFVISTAGSRRQLDALQSAVKETMKQDEDRQLAVNVEGDPESGWILIDYNSVIVHLFTEEMRDFYRLEDLWKNARVVARIQ